MDGVPVQLAVDYMEVLICKRRIHLVMARFRRTQSLRPVNRIKHVIDSQLGLALGTSTGVNLVKSVDAPVIANTSEVQTGATVNGIYLVVEATNTTAVSGVLRNIYMIVYKNPGGNITAPAPNAVGADDNKRYVIHQEMVMMQAEANGNPRTLFKGVIVLPRGYRRFGPGDLLELQLLSPGSVNNMCVQCHYKEFR